ncbi:MAG: hypothetical protein SFX73_23900 [Kofleriaceae bacterium]|nr:hypothetical protein [Kofleriaceae bacterium]
MDHQNARERVRRTPYESAMRKRLIQVGNSLALVLDKPIRKMIGFAHAREVELSFEGRRIIVDPVEEEDATCKSRSASVEELRAARSDLDRLVHFYGIADAQFQRLVAEYRRVFSYHAWLGSGLRHVTAAQLANIRRVRACVKQLDGGADWETAIAVALRSEPYEQQQS